MSFSRKQTTVQTFFFAFGVDKTKQKVICIILCIVGKFNWKGTIKAVLKQAPDNEISIKKLKKKVRPATNQAWNSRGGLVFMYACVV